MSNDGKVTEFKPFGMIRKLISCIQRRQWPNFLVDPNGKVMRAQCQVYMMKLRMQTFMYNLFCRTQKNTRKGKSLYASAIGQNGKAYLKTIIERFGHDEFDYMFFVYDDVRLDDPVFRSCTIIYDRGFKWYFMRKYLTPEVCRDYDYIFVWDDDIDIGSFDVRSFLNIMDDRHLQCAQPALSENSYVSHTITRQDKNVPTGRYTDFVEVMIPVFTSPTWLKFRDMIQDDWNHWGWGYDVLCKSYCGLSNIGIIDREPVTHVRPIQSKNSTAPAEMETFFLQHKKYKKALQIQYGIF